MQSLSLFGSARPESQDSTSNPYFRELIELPRAKLHYYPRFHDPVRATELLATFLEQTPWRQDKIRIAGKWMDVPRLQAWFGDKRSSYAYSGINLDPLPWTPQLLAVKSETEKLTGQKFNSVLLNLYRDGNDSVAWHSDDEAELGTDPLIASLSYGAERKLELRPRDRSLGAKRVMPLANGSLLLMGKGLQQHWQHQLPKAPGLSVPRVNLTFRYIHSMA